MWKRLWAAVKMEKITIGIGIAMFIADYIYCKTDDTAKSIATPRYLIFIGILTGLLIAVNYHALWRRESLNIICPGCKQKGSCDKYGLLPNGLIVMKCAVCGYIWEHLKRNDDRL
jgi:hypothetical protein